MNTQDAIRQRLALAKHPRFRRMLKAREPRVHELVKPHLSLKGPKTSAVVTAALKDLHKLHQPESKMLQRNNLTRPFEDQSSVEFLCQANDCGLFAYGSHSKKRPHNLILGRTFDGVILDMFEFNIDGNNFKSMHDLDGKREASVGLGSKPLLVFQGEEWESNDTFAKLKNFFIDYFRGDVIPKLSLSGVEHAIVLSTMGGNKILFRHYGILLRKSTGKLPRVELEEVGPRMDLEFKRHKQAPDDIVKNSLKVPKQAQVKLDKNIERDAIGNRLGRIHLQRQDIDKMALAHPKALRGSKRKREEAEGEEEGDFEGAGEAESEEEIGAGAGAEDTPMPQAAAAAAPAQPKKKAAAAAGKEGKPTAAKKARL